MDYKKVYLKPRTKQIFNVFMAVNGFKSSDEALKDLLKDKVENE